MAGIPYKATDARSSSGENRAKPTSLGEAPDYCRSFGRASFRHGRRQGNKRISEQYAKCTRWAKCTIWAIVQRSQKERAIRSRFIPDAAGVGTRFGSGTGRESCPSRPKVSALAPARSQQVQPNPGGRPIGPDTAPRGELGGRIQEGSNAPVLAQESAGASSVARNENRRDRKPNPHTREWTQPKVSEGGQMVFWQSPG